MFLTNILFFLFRKKYAVFCIMSQIMFKRNNLNLKAYYSTLWLKIWKTPNMQNIMILEV